MFQEPLLVFAEGARIEGFLLEFQDPKTIGTSDRSAAVLEKARSEGTLKSAIKSRAPNKRSGGMEGRPISLYIASKRGLKRLKTSKAQAFDFPDGVALGDPGIDVDHGQKLPLRLLPASHEPFYPIRIINTRFIFCFSSAC